MFLQSFQSWLQVYTGFHFWMIGFLVFFIQNGRPYWIFCSHAFSTAEIFWGFVFLDSGGSKATFLKNSAFYIFFWGFSTIYSIALGVVCEYMKWKNVKIRAISYLSRILKCVANTEMRNFYNKLWKFWDFKH